MKKEELTNLTDNELLTRWKKLKTTKIYDATIVGFLIGVAIYSTVVNGFGLLTFLPLAYLPVAAKNKKNIEGVKKLMESRNLR